MLCQFTRHYNAFRVHRALGQAAALRLLCQHSATETTGVLRHNRLGGLLHECQQVDRTAEPTPLTCTDARYERLRRQPMSWQ